jgi:hypothetical protein
MSSTPSSGTLRFCSGKVLAPPSCAPDTNALASGEFNSIRRRSPEIHHHNPDSHMTTCQSRWCMRPKQETRHGMHDPGVHQLGWVNSPWVPRSSSFSTCTYIEKHTQVDFSCDDNNRD